MFEQSFRDTGPHQSQPDNANRFFCRGHLLRS